MRVVRIDHVGIALHDAASLAPLLAILFPRQKSIAEEIPGQGVRVTTRRAGESALEFLERLGRGGPIDRFLEKRGNGIHHIALSVENLDEALDELGAAGFPLIDEKARAGAGGKRIAFLHPKGTGGILIELVEARR